MGKILELIQKSLFPTCDDIHGEFVENRYDDKCAVCRRRARAEKKKDN